VGAAEENLRKRSLTERRSNEVIYLCWGGKEVEGRDHALEARTRKKKGGGVRSKRKRKGESTTPPFS